MWILLVIDGCGKLTGKHDHMLTKIEAIYSNLNFISADEKCQTYAKLKTVLSTEMNKNFIFSLPASLSGRSRVRSVNNDIQKLWECIIGLTWLSLFIYKYKFNVVCSSIGVSFTLFMVRKQSHFWFVFPDIFLSQKTGKLNTFSGFILLKDFRNIFENFMLKRILMTKSSKKFLADKETFWRSFHPATPQMKLKKKIYIIWESCAIRKTL